MSPGGDSDSSSIILQAEKVQSLSGPEISDAESEHSVDIILNRNLKRKHDQMCLPKRAISALEQYNKLGLYDYISDNQEPEIKKLTPHNISQIDSRVENMHTESVDDLLSMIPGYFSHEKQPNPVGVTIKGNIISEEGKEDIKDRSKITDIIHKDIKYSSKIADIIHKNIYDSSKIAEEKIITASNLEELKSSETKDDPLKFHLSPLFKSSEKIESDLSQSNFIVLKSNNGAEFEVKVNVANQILLIKNFLEDLPENSDPIKLPNVSADILEIVIEYCELHIRDQSTSELIDSLKSSQLAKLINAAHYLMMDDLVQLSCLKFASLLQPMEYEEICEEFMITNDRTPLNNDELDDVKKSKDKGLPQLLYYNNVIVPYECCQKISKLLIEEPIGCISSKVDKVRFYEAGVGVANESVQLVRNQHSA